MIDDIKQMFPVFFISKKVFCSVVREGSELELLDGDDELEGLEELNAELELPDGEDELEGLEELNAEL